MGSKEEEEAMLQFAVLEFAHRGCPELWRVCSVSALSNTAWMVQP